MITIETVAEPKTTDYCKSCGESPESATHVGLGDNAHAYVPPDYLLKKPSLAAALLGGAEPNHVRVDQNGRVLTAPSLMRVMVEDRPGMPQFGVLVGMLVDERDDMQAVVRLDHYGIMLKMFHPSKVTPVSEEQEAAYKP